MLYRQPQLLRTANVPRSTSTWSPSQALSGFRILLSFNTGQSFDATCALDIVFWRHAISSSHEISRLSADICLQAPGQDSAIGQACIVYEIYRSHFVTAIFSIYSINKFGFGGWFHTTIWVTATGRLSPLYCIRTGNSTRTITFPRAFPYVAAPRDNSAARVLRRRKLGARPIVTKDIAPEFMKNLLFITVSY